MSTGMVTTSANQAEIGLCLFMADADGETSAEELEELKNKMQTVVASGTSGAMMDALADAERGVIADQGRAGYLAKLKDRIPADRREAAFRAAGDVAFADMLTAAEDTGVREVAAALGLNAKLVDEIAGPAI
jgi:uncharacterized tellurite resistance protein B-like protein